MTLNMLESLVRIKMSLKLEGKCCVDFKVTDQMLERSNSAAHEMTDGENELTLLETVSMQNCATLWYYACFV